MVRTEQLREYMQKRGYQILRIQSGKDYLIRYVKEKVPFLTVISEDELMGIIIDMEVDSNLK